MSEIYSTLEMKKFRTVMQTILNVVLTLTSRPQRRPRLHLLLSRTTLL